MKRTFLLNIFLILNFLVHAQVYKTVDITAGSLSPTLTVDEKNTITNLTLTGTIDARDFRTMRDNMTSLSTIDLSGVSIAAYSGSDGTYNYSATYAANSIPGTAFYNSITKTGKMGLQTILLPSSAISISSSAFLNCDGLSSVNIPSSVSTIGYGVFNGCKHLASISIPFSVTSLAYDAFRDCSALINVDANNPNYSSIDGVLFNKDQTYLISCPFSKNGDYSTPSTVATIGNSAFQNCTSLNAVNIPASVTTINSSAFQNCSGLVVVDNLNPNYSSADGILFNKIQTTLIQCPSSKSGAYTIPASVASIGSGAFYGCSALTSITAKSTVPINLSASSNVFSNVDKTTCTLNVPYGTKSRYASANQWKDFTTITEESQGILLDINTAKFLSEGGPQKVNVSSNVGWSVTANQSWVTVNPVSGTGNKEIGLSIASNLTNILRTAVLTVAATGVTSQTVTITQEGLPKTATVTAGNLLSSLTADELNGITSLVVTGTIDARDFKTMRDNMPLLSSVDLSGASIVAYTGTDGTCLSSWGTYTYQANTIPYYAFYDPNLNKGKTSLTSFIFPTSVTSINDSGFSGCSGITSISLPQSITSIGYNAFYNCTGLSSISLPSSLTSLEDYCFSGCIKLTNIEIPSSITSILNGVFRDCTALTSAVLPATIKSIGSQAFFNCNNLTSVNVPSVVTSIGSSAFSYCNKLTSLSIPASVKSIGISAFQGSAGDITVDAGNLYFSSIDGVLFNKSQTRLIHCPASKTGTVTIPSTVTSMEEYAFLSCSGITTINANPLTPVDLSTLYGVFNGVNYNTCILNVPYGTKVRYTAASQWKNFSNIIEETKGILPNPDTKSFTAIGGNVEVDLKTNVNWAANSDQTWVIVNPKDGTGDSKLTLTVGTNPNCFLRTSTITLSGTDAVSKTIIITQEGQPKIINNTASSGGILSTLPLEELNGITNLTITGTIDARDFKVMRDQMPLLSVLNLSGATITYYNGSDGTYSPSYQYTDPRNYSYPTNTIPENAFSTYDFDNNNYTGKPSLTNVILPSSITSVGNYAFSGCSGLSSITIPSLVTTIGNNVFENCSGLSSVNLPTSVTSLGNSTFRNCSALTSFAIPPQIISIGYSVFGNCKGLTSITIPSSVTAIGSNCFYNCTGLTSVSIPSSVTSIGGNAFGSCTSLTSMTIPISVNKIDYAAFQGCTGLSSIYANPLYPVDLSNSSNVFGNINKSTCTLNVPYGTKERYAAATQWKDFLTIKGEDQGILLDPLTKKVAVTGGNETITLKSNVSWTVSSSQPWVSPAPISGTGDNQLNLSISANPNCFVRTAVITASAAGVTSRTVTITQEGLPKTISIVAGTLSSSLTADELNGNTNLTITGTIDARDFKTMRDKMPLLAVVDLSAATIVSYTGTEGTLTYNNTYSANTIPSSAFYNQNSNLSKTSLNSVVLPNSAISIESNAFLRCTNLKMITLPSFLTTIKGSAFNGCTGLTSISVPSSVTTIEYSAFYNCSGLITIYAYPPIPVSLSNSDVFYNVSKTNCKLYVPFGSLAAYQSANYWKDFYGNIIEIEEPTANAGSDQTVNENTLVTLTGVASVDPDKKPLTYKWTAPSGITLSSETTVSPTFTAPEVTKDTNFTFSLVVSNGVISSTTDQVVITVKQVNKPPVANAGPDQTVTEGVVVTLDGTKSTDPDNDVLTYKWTAPAGITLNSTTTAKPTFTAPGIASDTEYTFTLKVTDTSNSSTTDQVVIKVLDVDNRILSAQLIGANSVEIDQLASKVWLYMPYGYDISTLSPTFEVSANATISPASGSVHDFSAPVVYTVTSENGLVKKQYSVEVYIPTVTLKRDIVTGWNWISLNGFSTSPLLSMSSLNFSELDYLKTATASAVYYGQTGWYGDLTSIPQSELLMLKKTTPEKFILTGKEINPAMTSIAVKAGWNRIGYLLKGNSALEASFDSNSLPSGEILLKSKDASAIYYPGTGWVGDLDSMRVLTGYMMKVTSAGNLKYQASGVKLKSAQQSLFTLNDLYSTYQINPAQYEFSANLIGEVVDSNGNNLVHKGDLLIAYAGNEPRGVTEARFIPALNRYAFIQTIFSNSNQGKLNFKLKTIDGNSEQPLIDELAFGSNEIFGEALNPNQLHLQVATTINETSDDGSVLVFPNPVNDFLQIKSVNLIKAVYLSGSSGNHILSHLNLENYSDQLDMSGLPPGVYILNLQTERGTLVKKLIKSGVK